MLRLRLVAIAAGLTLLGAGLGLALTYAGLRGLRLATLDDDNRLLASLIAEVAVQREDQAVRVPAVVTSYLGNERSNVAAHVYVDSQMIWAAGATTAPRPIDPERVLVGTGAFTVQEWRVYTMRDEDAGVVVQVGRTLQGLREVLGPYPGVAIGVVALVTLVSGLLAWWTVGLALRPLRRLSEATERVDEAHELPAIPGNDEPARLARAFAALLARLRDERRREHRFLAYAAHELRTPLTGLRAGLEAARSGRLEATPELIGRLHHEASRIETLAQNLLALSTAEVGDASIQTVDLERLAADAYDRFLPLALERGVALELDATNAPVDGDARLLDQALGNLVMNALKATRSGTVVIAGGSDDARAWLEVRDTGSGYDPATAGAGLGLRVVRAVARAHGGGFDIEGGLGTRARLWLPRSGTRA
jgi:two-component system, OmpR family, sensor kinase